MITEWENKRPEREMMAMRNSHSTWVVDSCDGLSSPKKVLRFFQGKGRVRGS